MKRRWPFVALAALITCVAVVGASRADHDARGLSLVRTAVDARYAGVAWVSPDTLASWLASDVPPQVLDSRTRAEFDVSHLAGAVWIDPARPDFAVVDPSPTRRVVVYCSVGFRSADIAQQLGARGRRHVFNLEQGLFGWANAGRPMVSGSAPATRVHPYDAVWGRMLLPDRRAPLP